MECPYCKSDDMPLLIKKYKYWRLILADSQQLIGWCHIILNRHAEHYEELTAEEMKELQVVLRDYKKAITKLFHPNHYNLMHMDNMVRHFHIVPRYKCKVQFGNKEYVDPDWGRMISDRWKPEDKTILEDLKARITKSINER